MSTITGRSVRRQAQQKLGEILGHKRGTPRKPWCTKRHTAGRVR